MSDIGETLDKLGEKVERASKQTPTPEKFFVSTYNWAKKIEAQEPPWGQRRGTFVDNRTRDEWLMMMSRAEPHLSSVLSTAVTLDANRQYKLIGGRNQVGRFVRKFRDFDDGLGFRSLQEFNALNYYSTDLGAIVEIETDGKNGPLESLYHADSTRFRIGNKRILKYDSGNGVKLWKRDQYYRLSSQKSTQDKYNQLGYCSVSRCIKLAQIMIAIVEHNLEKLAHIAPKGILFIQAEDLTQETWDQAMDARQAVYITGTGNQYYDEVVTIVDRAAKGDLLALSQLPDGFDTFQFTDYMLKGYALAFNRDVRAFWSLNSGNFGGGTEAKIQDEKATYAGAAEFILASQERLQELLPPSVLFEYEVDDTGGKIRKAELDQILIDSSLGLLELGITREEAKQWLAAKGVIPIEWTSGIETEVAENGVLKARYLATPQVQRALDEAGDDEPIVIWKSDGTQEILWESKRHAVKKYWQVKKNLNKRATIEDYDPDDATRGNFMYTAAAEQYLEESDNPTEEELAALALAAAMLSGEEPLDDSNVNELNQLLAIAIPIGILILLNNLKNRSDEALEESEFLFPERWNSRLKYFSSLGKLYGGDPTALLTWYLGDTIEHCSDCGPQDGITRTRAEWIETGLVPQSPTLECGGFHCDCDLR